MSDLDSAGNSNISLNLNGNKLLLGEDGRWTVQSKDFQLALLEVEKLVNEKEQLSSSLLDAVTQIDYLKDEVIEINKMKTVVLEMLIAERQQRIALENQLEGYREELRESFRTVVELRRLIPENE